MIGRKNKRYFLTSFGKIVYQAQKTIEMAAEEHWKLKAIDSIDRSDTRGLPAEELNKITNTLIKNQQIKDMLFGQQIKDMIHEQEWTRNTVTDICERFGVFRKTY